MSRSIFTPRYIMFRERRRKLACFLVLIFSPMVFFNLSTFVSANEVTTYDFSANPITLSLAASTSDSTFEAFKAGNTIGSSYDMSALLSEGGVKINQGYTYNQNSPINIGNFSPTLQFVEGDILYISSLSTSGGLYVVDSNGTFDPQDDTLVTRYHTGSTPALADNSVNDAWLEGGILYILTSAGLSVINTAGTLTPSDDTLVTRYHTGSVPALQNNFVAHTQLTAGLLYLSTSQGLSVIDTKNTTTASDDELIITYDTESTPALTDYYTFHSFLHGDNLYISTYDGLVVIDTKGTISPLDDVQIERYTTDKSPALINNVVNEAKLLDDKLFVSTFTGLSVISTQNEYQGAGQYMSLPRQINNTPTTSLNVRATITADQSSSLFYRSGTSTAVWREDFNTLDAFAGDFYGLTGGESDWQSVSAANGVLVATGEPLGTPSYAQFTITSGFPDDYFEAGSYITIRYRTSDVASLSYISFYADNLSDSFGEDITVQPGTSDWKIYTLQARGPFTNLTIDLYPDSENVGDATLELDYIQVTTPDSMGQWGSWNACTDISRCVLGNLGSNTWLQYKLELETDDRSTSPSVTEVIFEGPRQPSYTYTSETTTFTSPRRLEAFTPESTVPTNTAISYEYSVDGGATYSAFDPEQFDELDLTVSSFSWRATLSTTDPASTPTLSRVTLSHSDPPSRSTAVGVKEQLEEMEQSGQHDAFIKELRLEYPEVFNGTASEAEVRQVQLKLLREALLRMQQVLMLREEESNKL